MLEKDIYINVYPNESENPKAPTYSWNNFVFKNDVVIKAGTEVDITFWGNSISKEGKPNPHMKISNPNKPKGSTQGGGQKAFDNAPSYANNKPFRNQF
tara:strand:+ start:5187 stop:5480 length:294 start_codon:yes stop_codon:yes gene_type:complete